MHEVGHADPHASFDRQVPQRQGFVIGPRSIPRREKMRD